MKKKWMPNNQKGAIAVIFVIFLVVLIGFTALGIDAGRLYLAREKLKEAADAAAMAGVQAYGFSASGNCIEWRSLTEDVLKENFPDGYLGCQLYDGDIDINYLSSSGAPRVNVNLCVTCDTFFAGIFGIDTVRVCASEDYSVAERVPVEIMLVLDRSGGMAGAIGDLRSAAKSFADHFKCTEDVDRMGLITYATGVKVPFDLQNNFVEGIKEQIDGVVIRDSVGDMDTNMEDALDQADDDKKRNGDDTTTFTDQSGLPQNERVKQFLVFFTDGRANSFRGKFTRGTYGSRYGDTYDAVVPDPYDWAWGEHRQGEDVCEDEGEPEVTNVGWFHDPYTGEKEVENHIDPFTGQKVFGGNYLVDFLPTGDGKIFGETECKWDCGGNYTSYETTKWPMFDPLWNDEYDEYEDDYSIDGYSSPYCNINEGDLKVYTRSTAKKMTIYHAGKLKEQNIIIYCVGLGSVDEAFLKEIASKEEYYYHVTSSSDMIRIFNQIAMEIKKYVYLVK
ncbi:MAG: VWA domain-containing protein [Deltaproteobacteria bacterium]|nr:VWA domain-containing protein [Deltaproteobacteria bacterium]